jgi:CSLREA domain-containing protein
MGYRATLCGTNAMTTLLRHALLLLLSLAPGAHAATFTVDVAGDGPAGACSPGNCSLRNAIVAANTAAGADTIAFALAAGPGGVVTIAPTSPLPAITGDDTMIDGFSQPGASPGAGIPDQFTGTIKVFVDGAGAGANAPGLRVAGNRITIRGLAIRGFSGAQIDISGSNNVVRGNLIGLSPEFAVAVPMPALGVRIAPLAASVPRGNVIGGTVVGNDRNIIAGHRTAVLIENAGFGSNFTEENRVSGNFINVAADASAPLPGEHGVQVRNSRNVRIGTADSPPAADANDIGGVTSPESFGIVIVGGSRIFVDSNWIGGTQRGVSHPLGTGVFVTDGAREVFVQWNVVFAVRNNGFEVRDGIAAPGTTTVLFERNSVLSVGGLAIDLAGDGSTPNDASDVDVGPNRLLNTPTLTDVRAVASNVLLDFTLNAEPNRQYNVEAFLANKPRPTSLAALATPGAKNVNPWSPYAVSAIFSQSGGSVTTDASGNASGTVTVPRFAVPDGFALSANATLSLQSGCCFVTGEMAYIDAPVIPDESIIAFDHAIDVELYNPNAIFYTTVEVTRSGSLAGAASVTIRPEGGAETLPDISPSGTTLTWADGDGTTRSFAVTSNRPEPTPGRTDTPTLALSNPVGATLGTPRFYTLNLYNRADVEIIVDEIFGGSGGGFEERGPPG